MEESRDFIQWLGVDMAAKILMFLDHPCDLVRTSAVSRSWREFGEFAFVNFDLVVHSFHQFWFFYFDF